MKAVIIYSGGMDSTTLLHHFKDSIALAISFDYGSKHNDQEFEYAKMNTSMLGIPHERVDLKAAMSLFKSDLLQSGGDIPEGHYAADNMSKTVVPFRNGIMLSIAAGIAESHGLDAVLIANHFGDDAQYPDCRLGFITPFNQAVQAGTDGKVSLVAPYTDITKKDIAEIGLNLGLDYAKTWSCYKEGKVHCGKCGTCVERVWALQGNDPTEYLDKEFAIETLRQAGEWNE